MSAAGPTGGAGSRPRAPAFAMRGAALAVRVTMLGILAAPLASAGAARAATLLGLIDTGELYASNDGGASWTGLAELPVRDAVGLQARFAASELYLASRSGGIYRSLDGGVSWSAVGAIAAGDVEDLLVRSDGAVMVLTRTGSVYRSTDQGATFSAIAALTASDFISLTQRTDARIYAVTATGSVFESTTLGTSWTPKSAITVANATRIRAIGQTLYVMTATGDIMKSVDAGASWSSVGTLSQVGMRGLVRNGATLVAASREGHVATSSNGVAWTWQGSINQLTLTALATNTPATTDAPPSSGAGSLALGAPFPNPSPDGAGLFPVRLEREERIVLELCDLAGRLVARRAPEWLPAGSTTLAWSPRVSGSGLYFARLVGDSGVIAERRWVVLR